VLPYLVSGILARPVARRAQSSNAALPSVGEVTFVGGTIRLPRSGDIPGMAVQPEKVNEGDAEPSS
jgi:hypothetical protein